jgi:NADH dehydrogenase [ubiquinone] 1 alpha subcomplex assembly factor 7
MKNPLYERIAREAAQHPLTIARYMEWALQHPEYGYYRQGQPLGAAGDFVTAPDISQIFGELIGLWCVDIWWQMGQPPAFTLLELGPGRGTLMADALRAAAKQPRFLQAMQLVLHESNPDLRALQSVKLGAYRPAWRDDLLDLPALPTIIIANEFFDALPVRQFVRRASGWMERCIGVADGTLGWVDVPLTPLQKQMLTREEQALPIDAVVEIGLPAIDIMRQCAGNIVRYGGALLTFDYGSLVPSGQPTFQAVARHAVTDPLAAPGEADLTAHVNFAALESAALAAGATVWDVQEQGAFLQALGLAQRAAQLAERTDAVGKAALAAACQRLTAPDAMGKLFKVFCLTGTPALIPAGWSVA